MQYPNKTYIARYDRYVNVLGHIKKVVLVAAPDEQTASNHLLDKIGSLPEELIWIMDCQYKTIYDQTGTKKLEPQAKILFNG